MEIEGRISSKAMLINYLIESKSFFSLLQDVAKQDSLKEKFGGSILNIEKSIEIIKTELSREEIKDLVRHIRQNIKDDKAY